MEILTRITQFILDYIFVFSAFFAGVAGIFASLKEMQMFQQNSYFPKRYISFLSENKKGSIVTRAIFYFLFACLNLKGSGLAKLLVFFALFVYMIFSVFSALLSQKKSIIPLKFTSRIKRNYFLLSFIFVVFIVIQYLLNERNIYFPLSLNLILALFPQLTVLILWAFLYPLEKAINKHYIKDAKRILASFKNLTVIGITGSYGKTGTKTILTAMLKESYNVMTTPKNFNTPMGVVRAVRENLKNAPQTEIFLCEMGAKNVGDIAELCAIADPSFGIITSVGPQHLDTFGNITNVFNTKFELYDYVNKKGSKVFVCGDSEEINKSVGQRNVILYGTDSSYDFYADNITFSSRGATFDLHLKDECITVTTKLLGSHNILNIVGCAAMADTFGVSAEKIRFAISRLSSVPHRLEIKSFHNSSILIDDAYNANPVGSKEACRVLSRFENMTKFIVTPGLVELGEEEYKHNFALGVTAAECADYIILVGKERSKPLKEGALSVNFPEDKIFTVSSFGEAMEKYLPFASKDTVLLIENDLPDNYLK